MPVIAVVNRKGGSGKSTLATHLAAYCANAGHTVMLGDVDRQQSTQDWLHLRSGRAPILGWTVDPRRGLQPPPGTTHVILDTPGGLSGFELARVVMFSDAILMPVCNSVFDRESAARCLAELRTLPRVASGRCQLGAVGMRLDARTRAADVLRDWADELLLPFVGVLRDTQAYVRCLENGMTLFDLPDAKVHADLLQWAPILRWLWPVLNQHRPQPAQRVARPGGAAVAAAPSLPSSREPQMAQESHNGPKAPKPCLSQKPGAATAPAAAWEQELPDTPARDVTRIHASEPAPRTPVGEPPVLTAVLEVQAVVQAQAPAARTAEMTATPRADDMLPSRFDDGPAGMAPDGEPLSLGQRMRGLLDRLPMRRRGAASPWCETSARR